MKTPKNIEKIQEKAARKILNAALDKFTEEVREVIQRKVNDSIDVDEINGGTSLEVMQIVLGWVQRITNETIGQELGERALAQYFDNGYFQICGQKMAPEDFRKRAKPYKDV